MPFLSSTGLLAFWVLLSLIFTIATTENPAQVPFRLVLRRAAFGMALFILFWSAVCTAIYELLVSLVPSLETSQPFRWCAQVLIGLVVPQSGKLKDAFLTQRAARYLKFIQLIDEATRLYLTRIIRREERKFSTSCLGKDSQRQALDRLFEEHNIEIAREEARELYPPESALNIFKVRHPAVKIKYLLRHLGYSDCLRELRTVAAKPEIILPSWPADQGDRRIGGVNDTMAGGFPFRRRKYEQSHVQAYLLNLRGTKFKKKYQVFVSSTYLDLREERQQVLKALLACECIPAGMEFFPASDEELWSLIKGIVDECDYYILLIGGRYGSITKDGVSYTEAEYDYAVRSGKPVLAFLYTGPSSTTSEGPEKRERLNTFKEKICRAHAPGYWGNPAEIPFLVQQALEKVKREHPSIGWSRIERPS